MPFQAIENSDTASESTLPLFTLAMAALARHTQAPDHRERAAPEAEYLRSFGRVVAESGAAWDQLLEESLKAPHAQDQALAVLGRRMELSPAEMLASVLAAAVEREMMVGRALAYLQAPVGGSRPTVGLLATVFDSLKTFQRGVVQEILTGAALESGLLILSGNGHPVPEQHLSVPLPACLALEGEDGAIPGATPGAAVSHQLALPDSIAEEAARQGDALAGSGPKLLVIRSGSPSESAAVAAAVADAMHRRPLFLVGEIPAGLAPVLILRELVPVFRLEVAPGEKRDLPAIPGYRGPLLAVCGPDGTVLSRGETGLNWVIPKPQHRERKILWRNAIDSKKLADRMARHHRHGAGRIAQLGHLARHATRLSGRTRLDEKDLLAAAWTAEGAGLDALALPLREEIGDAALVTTAALAADLETLLARCRSRDGLVKRLGASARARYQPGVRVLFVGPSGTGKTLAAGWLATRLGLPVYRVDLAAVTSKYIGETEKNLSQLLARAEQSEVVLLFDEADALFGKRTEVQQANDRFANAQTNYLLQRMETFDGIAVLTSNSRSRFDTAFARRLDMIVDFPIPGPRERRRLWRSHLGSGHDLEPGDLNLLSAAADITGGHIRNVVLAAAVTARAGRRPIALGDIIRALKREYRKIGRQLPVELASAGLEKESQRPCTAG